LNLKHVSDYFHGWECELHNANASDSTPMQPFKRANSTFESALRLSLTASGLALGLIVNTANAITFANDPNFGAVSPGTYLGGTVQGPPLDTNGTSDHPNSTFGELSGDTRVAFYAPWIDSVIGAVPEPASWALILAGLVGIGAATRRSSCVREQPL